MPGRIAVLWSSDELNCEQNFTKSFLIVLTLTLVNYSVVMFTVQYTVCSMQHNKTLPITH